MIANQTLIHTFLDIQRQHMDLMSKHKDQYHEHMHTMAHQSIDSSIETLKKIHAHLSSDDSGHKSDVMSSMIKASIDSRHHFKNGLTHHKADANIHKSYMRKLSMGVMAAFGLMSGVKAAGIDAEVGQPVAAGSAVVTSVTASQSSRNQIASNETEACRKNY